MSAKFRSGEVYFRLTFPDVTMAYPKIETFVFVGKNLSDEDQEDIWYFQFADSYVKFGSILETAGGDRRVRLLKQPDLHEMLDQEGLGKRPCADEIDYESKLL